MKKQKEKQYHPYHLKQIAEMDNRITRTIMRRWKRSGYGLCIRTKAGKVIYVLKSKAA